MKSGQLLGGIAIGAIVGIGVGYLLGVDAEKRNQWLRMIGSKVLGNQYCDDTECGCDKETNFETKAE